MRYSLFIARRISDDRHRSFSRLIVVIARLAIALSLTVMIVASGMVNGFRDTISEKLYGFWGHISVSKESLRNSFDDLPLPYDSTFTTWARQQESISAIQPYARKAGIIKSRGQMEGVILKGISDEFYWEGFSKYIIDGQKPNLTTPEASDDMMLSKAVAGALELKAGDSAILHFVDKGGENNYRQRFRKLHVSGIYSTGLEEFDKLFALADLRHVQNLNNWADNEIGGYEIYIHDLADLDATWQLVNDEANPFWEVQTLYQLIPGIFDWLNLQKINERIILLLMFVVALINMVTSLLILILERANMIGVLKAMGATNRGIREIFLLKAANILVWGIVIGNIAGLSLCLIQQRFGLIRLPEESYYVSVAPVSIHVPEILLINLGTLVVSLLFLVIPSSLISRIRPVKAIRFS
jgi:lipoprotein-releasing system permease protein